MKNKLLKQTIAVVTATSCLTMTGCSSSFVTQSVENYPLVPALTEQEVIDYYAKALEYDAIVTRAVDETKVNLSYEIQPIAGQKEEVLKKLVSRAEQILSSDEYKYEGDNAEIVPEDTYIYIKSILDNVKLTRTSNDSVVDIGQALGFYFVDVQYDISAQTSGKFTDKASLLGLNGVWLHTYDDSYKLDAGYMQTVMNKMNEYFYDNNEMRCAYFNPTDETFEIVEGLSPTTYGLHIGEDRETAIDNTSSPQQGLPSGTEGDQSSSENPLGTEGEEGTEGTEGETTEGTEGTEGENEQGAEGETETPAEETVPESTPEPTQEPVVPSFDGEVQAGIISYTSQTPEDRRPVLDSKLINSVVGSSLRQRSFVPDLKLVYEPSSGDTLGGFGIYPEALSGLRAFGYDRESLNGKITLRYVFKDDISGSGKILGANIYVLSEEVATGVNMTSGNVLIPSYLEQEFKNLIERMDRVQCNVDISGMMNGNIYEDMGHAVLAGYKDSGARTLKHMSTIRQVVARDMENNSYLVEIETTVMDGPRSVDCYGTYRDKYYVVIQQQGDKFVISDMAKESRIMTEEPPLDVDKAIEKRLVALNLAGEVDDQTREEVRTLISELYTAGTNRILSTQEVDGKMLKGMYECFNADPEMLSSKEKEYINSTLRNKLIKYGVDTKSVHSGYISEFIGGWDNQVEFTADELITYAGRDTGCYMQVYYLVSKMNDYWVIDERRIIDERDVEGNELNSLKESMGVN